MEVIINLYYLSKKASSFTAQNRDGAKLFWGAEAQYSRHIVRLFLIIVLMTGLFGSCYAYRNWQVTPETLQLTGLTGEGDWIDLVSLLGEKSIQWFLEWTDGE